MTLPEAFAACQTQPGAMDSEISALERDLGQRLPDDYSALLRESNGMEGFIAPEAYIVLWSVGNIHSLNEAYSVSEFLPGVVLLGTDGSGTGYGFTSEGGHVQYVSVPLVGMDPNEMSRLGNTFEGLLERLRKENRPA